MIVVTSPETAVDEALEGLVMLHPGLRLLQDHRVVVREKVSLLIWCWSSWCEYVCSFCLSIWFQVTNWKQIMLFQIESGKVALISGGGSGHEPFCAGYIGIGYGLLVNLLAFWCANFWQTCRRIPSKKLQQLHIFGQSWFLMWVENSPQEMVCWQEGWLDQSLPLLLQVALYHHPLPWSIKPVL